MFRKEIKVVLIGAKDQQDSFIESLKGNTSQDKSDDVIISQSGYKIKFNTTSEKNQSAAHKAIEKANGIIILSEYILITFRRQVNNRKEKDGIPVIDDSPYPTVCIERILNHIENMKHGFKVASKEEKSEGVIENVKSFFKLFDKTLAHKINEFKEKNIQGIDRDQHSLN